MLRQHQTSLISGISFLLEYVAFRGRVGFSAFSRGIDISVDLITTCRGSEAWHNFDNTVVLFDGDMLPMLFSWPDELSHCRERASCWPR